MKKTFSLLVLIGIGLALSSCGGGGGDSKSKDKKDTSVVKDAGDILSSSSSTSTGSFVAPKSLSEVKSIQYTQTYPFSYTLPEETSSTWNSLKVTYSRVSNTQATLSYSSSDSKTYQATSSGIMSATGATIKDEHTITLKFTSATKGTYTHTSKKTIISTGNTTSSTSSGTFKMTLK